jgi:hypothetical protein
MVHGTPDWWGQGRKPNTFALNDMAELATRLGSDVNYDRLGECIYIYNGDRGIEDMGTITWGTGAEVYLQNGAAVGNGMMIYLMGGSESMNKAMLEKTIRHPQGDTLGIEIVYSFTEELDYMEIDISDCDGVTEYEVIMRYSYTHNTISIYQADGTWLTVITNIGYIALNAMTHNLKVVYNVGTGNLVRLLMDDKYYDMSAYSAYYKTTSIISHVQIRFNAVSDVGGSGGVGLHKIILTQNEPT